MALQRELGPSVIRRDDIDFQPRLLCGIDVAYDRDIAYVAAVIWDANTRVVAYTRNSVEEIRTGYIPGFLGFREGPLLAGIAARLETVPDVFLIDGHGLAHPRRFGVACHVGIALDKPTIGVAKSLLYGRIRKGEIVAGEGEVIGQILTTLGGRKYYISVGHRISLPTAIRIVQHSIVDGFCAPLRAAHLNSMTLKRETGR